MGIGIKSGGVKAEVGRLPSPGERRTVRLERRGMRDISQGDLKLDDNMDLEGDSKGGIR